MPRCYAGIEKRDYDSRRCFSLALIKSAMSNNYRVGLQFSKTHRSRRAAIMAQKKDQLQPIIIRTPYHIPRELRAALFCSIATHALPIVVLLGETALETC